MQRSFLKRLCGFTAALVMIQSAVPVFADSEKGVSMQGIYAIYQTIKADCTGFNAADAVFEWQYSDTESGAYSPVSDNCSENPDEIWLVQGGELKKTEPDFTPIKGEETVTKDAWLVYGTMENSLAGKWIKVKATVGDDIYESAPRQIAETIGSQVYNITNSGDNKLPFLNETTPSENVFTVGEEDFILLDTTEAPDRRFFVLAKNLYGDRVYYNTACYSGQSFNELSYWLDNYLTLPEVIESHIAENYWLNERPKWSHVNNLYQMAVLGKIAVPSQIEIIKYSDKIGLQDDGRDWWTRTPAAGSSGDGNDMIYVCGSKASLGKTSNAHAQNNQKGIRPVFYLDDSFFKDAKIPFDKMGSAVRKEIFERYTNDELKSFGYSEDDITDCKNGEITDVVIKGDAKVNGTLTATYKNNGASEKYISFSWKLSDSENGKYSEISKEKEYQVPADAAEKWIKIVIGYAGGKYAESVPIMIKSLWDDAFTGSIQSVKLKGVYETFQNIKAEYEFDDITGEDDIVYKNWYMAQSKNGSYQNISSDEILRTDTSYAGKWIKYGITLKNRRVFYSEPHQIGAAWSQNPKELTGADGGNPLSVINKTTPPEYTFTIDGEEFIMLDHFDSDSSAFLIMAKDNYGIRRFYPTDMGQLFSDMIKWLNNDFYVGGNGGKKLPKSILGYIDMEQGWKTEKRRYDDSTESGYYGGISLPALTELKKYAERIGLQDSGDDWWLRTPTSDAYVDGNYMQYVCGDEEKLGCTAGKHGTTGSAGIRPIFYISKDYFLENKLDFETTGSEVYHELAKRYTKNELRGLYDLKTLEELFGYPDDYEFSLYDIGGITQSDGVIYANLKSSNGDRNVILLIGIYSSDGKLIYVNSKKIALVEGELNEVLFEYQNLGEDTSRTVSAHVLEEKNGRLIPIYSGKNAFDE